MQRPTPWFALFVTALLLGHAARAEDILHSAQSASVFGPANPLLARSCAPNTHFRFTQEVAEDERDGGH